MAGTQAARREAWENFMVDGSDGPAVSRDVIEGRSAGGDGKKQADGGVGDVVDDVGCTVER